MLSTDYEPVRKFFITSISLTMTKVPEVIGKVLVKYDDGTSSKHGTNKDAHIDCNCYHRSMYWGPYVHIYIHKIGFMLSYMVIASQSLGNRVSEFESNIRHSIWSSGWIWSNVYPVDGVLTTPRHQNLCMAQKFDVSTIAFWTKFDEGTNLYSDPNRNVKLPVVGFLGIGSSGGLF